VIHPETDWLAKWAGYRPGKVALRDHGRGLEWTYLDGDARARRLAAHLRDGLGVVAQRVKAAARRAISRGCDGLKRGGVGAAIAEVYVTRDA
jgi:acyl-CoA synthetase (AMP-forming)/AMP-acid ligase II